MSDKLVDVLVGVAIGIVFMTVVAVVAWFVFAWRMWKSS
jgi:hypothetical protein